MRYSDNIHYLVPAIHYLGTNSGWWARSPRELAKELSLNEQGLLAAFEGFPAIFRKSKLIDPQTRQHFYALQARYAKRDGSDLGEQERVIDVPPLPIEHLKLVLDFVLQMAEVERAGRRSWISSFVAVAAAVIAAVAAIIAAGVRLALSAP
jgi:hypothetical protein